jgi:penicillin-binding protein 2
LRRKQLIKEDEEEQERKQFHFRFFCFIFILVAFLFLFSYLLFNTQIVKGADYLEQSSRKISDIQTVEAARGSILDCYGRTLVSNRLSYNVTLNPSYMGSDSDEVQTLLNLIAICTQQQITWSDTLPLSTSAPFTLTLDSASDSVKSRFTALATAMKWSTSDGQTLFAQMRDSFDIDSSVSDSDARNVMGVLYELLLRSKNITSLPYVFAEDVNVNFISIVKEKQLPGVSIDTSSARNYDTTVAAHVLGRVGLMSAEEWPTYQTLGYTMDAVVGKEGAESAFESSLHGVNGTRSVETNKSGKVVDEEWITEPQPGNNVVLTLDSKLQQYVEQQLADYVPTVSTAKGAACVIMDVNTGGILALASYPTYDLSQFSQTYSTLASDPLKPLYNRATLGTYAPGSTFKPVVAIGALEEGVITPSDTILDKGIYTYYSSPQPQCWIYREYHQTHGLVNVTKAIEVSCNYFFFDVGRRLGIDKIDEYATKFGLGQRTGIEIPESTGVLTSPAYTESLKKDWNVGMTLNAAIGQQDSQFTPLQICDYIATLVNGGKHYKAHLLQSVKSSDSSQTISDYEPQIEDTISIDPTALNAVKEGMLAVTQSGSVSSSFKNLNIKVGAKTGSAQVSATSESNALFVAFAPYDNPQIAMCIIIEKGGGGSTIGNIASNIISYYFNSSNTVESNESENTLLP